MPRIGFFHIALVITFILQGCGVQFGLDPHNLPTDDEVNFSGAWEITEAVDKSNGHSNNCHPLTFEITQTDTTLSVSERNFICVDRYEVSWAPIQLTIDNGNLYYFSTKAGTIGKNSIYFGANLGVQGIWSLTIEKVDNKYIYQERLANTLLTEGTLTKK